MKQNNEKIIARAIDTNFGAGAYDKVKSSPEAVQELLDYISTQPINENSPKVGVFHGGLR